MSFNTSLFRETANLLNEEIANMAPVSKKRPLESSSSFNSQPTDFKRSRTTTPEEDALELYTSSKKTRPTKFSGRSKKAGSPPPLIELAQPKRKEQENKKPAENQDEKLARVLAKMTAKHGTTKVSTALKPLKFEITTMEARKKNLAELKKAAQLRKQFGDPADDKKKPKRRAVRRPMIDRVYGRFG